MENIKLIPSFKNEEEMKNFFTERVGIQNAFNEKVEDLKKEAKLILEGNEEKILYSIPLPSETFVRLSVDAVNNFYHQIKHLYSKEDGILLEKIQIVLHEYLSDSKFENSLRIRFIFVQKEFNNHWNSFSLDRLYCDDEDFELSDQSMGPCLDPKFLDPEKYFFVKGCINEVKNILSKIEKEKNKKK